MGNAIPKASSDVMYELIKTNNKLLLTNDAVLRADRSTAKAVLEMNERV